MTRTLPRISPWTPGTTGKGIVTPLGAVYTWDSHGDMDGGIAHMDALAMLRVGEYEAAHFLIDEDGAVEFHSNRPMLLDKLLAADDRFYLDTTGEIHRRYWGDDPDDE